MKGRSHLKDIVKFAQKEYEEKRPKTVKVLRVKAKSIFTRGVLPSLDVKQLGRIQFVVLVEYARKARVYLFSKNAQMVGGENIEKESKKFKKIKEATTKHYSLPKEKEKTTIHDITRHFRKKFTGSLTKVNQNFGLNLTLPFVIEADAHMHLKKNRSIGVKYTRNKVLKISAKLYKKKVLDFIINREIFFHLLKKYLLIELSDKETNLVIYDLAIFLTNIYARGRYTKLILKILTGNQKLFLNLGEEKIELTAKMINTLQRESDSISKNDTFKFLKNIFRTLMFLGKCGLKINRLEFLSFYLGVCDDFSAKSLLLSSSKQSTLYNFLLKIFIKSYEKSLLYELDRNSKKHKERFLILVFTMLSQKTLKNLLDFTFLPEDLHALINEINTFSTSAYIGAQIKNIDELSDLALKTHIFSQILQINYKIRRQNKKLILTLTIRNKGNVVFRNFSYRLNWKPPNRIKLSAKNELIKALDLHEKLQRKYILSKQNEGKVTFHCIIKFQNPSKNGNEMFSKQIKLGVRNLEKN
ncbi:MAG: hypothetical protein R6U96_03525 [Promethearchaeia archaeon]